MLPVLEDAKSGLALFAATDTQHPGFTSGLAAY
jgi:hypothetical protein